MASDNSPTVETPAAPTLETALSEYNAAVPPTPAEPAPPPPTLESLLAEFERGTGSDADARRAADMIRQRDALPSDPTASSAAPDAPPPEASAEASASAEPEVYHPPFNPPWLSGESIQEEIHRQKMQKAAEYVDAAFAELRIDGITDERITEKLNALTTSDAGRAAFAKGERAWNSLVAKAKSDLQAEVDGVAQRQISAHLSDVVAARAAVANSGFSPLPPEPYDPVAVSRMSDREYQKYLETKYPNTRRR